ncbi:MAG: RNA polymerase sigma-70 factor [Reichenbachiella sp.]
MQIASESNLISELNDGQVGALNKLFDEHYAAMMRHAYALTHNKEVSEELTQDVFVSLWNKRETFDLETSFRPYLIQAIRNRCYTYFRREYSKDTIAIDLVNDPESNHTTDMSIHSSDLKDGIALALGLLPMKTKAVFLMSREEEMSNQDIAQRLEISLKTVEYHMGKALKSLKFSLDKMGFFTFWLVVLWGQIFSQTN